MLVKVEFIYHMLVYFRIKYNVQQSKIKCARAQRSKYFYGDNYVDTINIYL